MSEQKNPSRRDLLAATAAVGLGALAAQEPEAKPINEGRDDLKTRRDELRELRTDLARKATKHPFPPHPTNGDEQDKDLFPFLGNFSKGLKHDKFGQVVPDSYKSLLHALRTGRPEDFEKIILGTRQPPSPYEEFPIPGCVPLDPKKASKAVARKAQFYRSHSERQVVAGNQATLVNPQAGLAFDLEGSDSHALVIPPPPSFRSKEIIAEIAENYWMAVLRDIPLGKRTAKQDALVEVAANDLSGYTDFRGPKDQRTGKVTPETLFRGTTPGDLAGPYISQFLLRSVPFGAYRFPQKVVFSFVGDPDFLCDAEKWLAAQNGTDPRMNPQLTNGTYVYRGRDLGNYVHVDELFQAYLLASLSLDAPPGRGGLGAPHDAGNPYDGYAYDSVNKKHLRRASTQQGFGTLGGPNFKGLVTEVGTRALKAVWYQKWFVHRRLRPETFAGRIHFQVTGKRDYPFDKHELAMLGDGTRGVLKEVMAVCKKNNGDGFFLPMAFPEGCPLHPAYGAGHATVAAACTTVLKAVFHEEITFADLQACVYLPSANGTDGPEELTPKDGKKYDAVASKLTIGGELNKLASNISLGRNFAGVHWRSDHAESLLLGERVAINFLRETVQTYNERVSFTLTRFDGTREVLSNN